MRTRVRLAAIVAMVSTFLVACGSGGTAGGDGGLGDGTPTALAGRTFLSTAVTVDGEDHALVPGTRITLEFAEDTLRVSAGCNILGGSWTLEGTTLVVSEIGGTEMGCDPALHEQDEWLAEILGSRPTVASDDDVLTLTAGETTIELLNREVADPDRPLVGTEWRGDSIVEGETVSSVAGLEDVSLVIAEDGTFRVSTGCNEGGGRVEVGDGTLIFVEFLMTERACPDLAGVEAAVVAVLGSGEVAFEIEGPTLTLTAGSQGLVLRAR